MAPSRILIADDDEACRKLLVALTRVAFRGATATLACDGGEAIEHLTRDPAGVVVTDLHMPRANGIDVARAARRANPGALIVLLSGALTPEHERVAVAAGASTCMRKPFDVDQFIRVLRGAATESPTATARTSPRCSTEPM